MNEDLCDHLPLSRREQCRAVFTTHEDADANRIELAELGWDNLDREEHGIPEEFPGDEAAADRYFEIEEDESYEIHEVDLIGFDDPEEGGE